jgi:hypothetical protein
MAPRRWTSPEQLLWLQNELPTYLQMQKEKKLPRFFELMFSKWFSDFAEETEPSGSAPSDENVIDTEEMVELPANTNSDEQEGNALTITQEMPNGAINDRRKVRFTHQDGPS